MQVHELINFNARQQRHGNMGNMAPQQVCYPSTGRRSIDDRRYYATVYPIEYSIEEPLSPRPWQLPSLSNQSIQPRLASKTASNCLIVL